MPDGQPWPLISVVTPSFNQAPYLEATLRSILLQGYPNLEYFVMDGGSTDGSVDIIRTYASWLTKWVSEPDGGQSAAINRALQLSAGLFFTWINSDDMLCRNALVTQASRFGFDPGVVYVGDCLYIDEHDGAAHLHRGSIGNFEELVRVSTVWRGAEPRRNIDQPAVCFPRELALKVQGLNVSNHLTMDYELWGKFFLAGAKFEYTHIPFGVFRVHAQQKTSQWWATSQSLIATAEKLVGQSRDLPDSVRDEIVADLHAYRRTCWRETGRLAQLGLPESVVVLLRKLHANLRRRSDLFLRRSSRNAVGQAGG